jgi:hypothetical protein
MSTKWFFISDAGYWALSSSAMARSFARLSQDVKTGTRVEPQGDCIVGNT